MRPRIVLSMEQALSLSYATLRFAHLGWRVIRLEATPRPGQTTPGDPNRYVGREAAGPDRRSYYLAPNVGKEAIALNLTTEEGRETLRTIIRELPVDVFASNTLPSRYEKLGIDYETLSAENPKLIWAGISAMGPDDPNMPGYDPALQALTGYMELTGQPDGPPTLMGVPMIDLKAGDEVFAQTMLGLAELAETGKGRRIDVSMCRAAVSWLHTTLPLLDLGADPGDVRRSGNEHREFHPVNVYETEDGWLYLAIGNDVQWKRLIGLPGFASLAGDLRETNEGRRSDRPAVKQEISAVMRSRPTAELLSELRGAGLVVSPVHTIAEVLELPGIREHLTRTRLPDGREVRLPPTAVETGCERLDIAPRYGEHTRAVLGEAGISDTVISDLIEGERALISDEIRHLLETGSAIRKMWSEGNRLKAEHGAENVADMTLGNPVLPPPPALLEALEEVVRNPPAGSHRYTPHAGIPEVRERVAAYLAGHGLLPDVQAEHIVMTAGASAAINVTLRTILNPGDEVILLAPYFPDYPSHVMNHSGVPVVVQCGPGFLPDPYKVERAISRRTRALIVNHPNNPSGQQYPNEILAWLGGVVDKASKRLDREIYLISDEPYREILYSDEPFHSPARFSERGLMIYSYSKSHSIPGERIGYLAVNPACPAGDELLAGLALSNRILGFTNAPALWQQVVSRCLDTTVDTDGYRRHRDRLQSALEVKGYEVVPADGTFYLFPRTPGGDDEEFIARAMKDLLLVVPGGTFGWPGHFRIAFCVDDRAVDLAIERLPEAVAVEEDEEV